MSRYLTGGAVSAFFAIVLGLGGFLYRQSGLVDQHQKTIDRLERREADWYMRSDALRNQEGRQREITEIYNQIREVEGRMNDVRETLGGQNVGDLEARIAHIEGRMGSGNGE